MRRLVGVPEQVVAGIGVGDEQWRLQISGEHGNVDTVRILVREPLARCQLQFTWSTYGP